MAEQPDKDMEPRKDLQDESQERNRKVDQEQFDASPAVPAGAPDDPAEGKTDESQERNEEVDDIIEGDEDLDDDGNRTSLGLRSEKDGGYASEDLPVVRVGEVYEDIRPAKDDHRRYVKVLAVYGEEIDDAGHGGKVLVQNEETYRRSRIGRDRFTPENGWARFAS